MLKTATHTIEDFEEITIQNGQILVNKKHGDPMKPLDHHIYPNRHERRKAKAIHRRGLRKGLYDW